MAKRTARRGDIHAFAMALPEVTQGEGWGGRPTYAVRGKNFVVFREPRKDAVDEETGERLEDVVMFLTPSQEDKEALLQSGPPWFTTPHFDGYDAVLLRERDISRVSRAELEEVIRDAWLRRAPKRLAQEWLAKRRPS